MALAMAILLEGDGSINENPEGNPWTSFRVRDGVAYVTFNRPQARNALTFAMYERLAEICTNANAERSVRAILITGAGDKAFAAGTDISQFRTFDKEEDALAYEARIDRVMNAIERCRVPTIAAINGACTGGGASIAACCDLRIASRSMKYGFPVARTLGNCLRCRATTASSTSSERRW